MNRSAVSASLLAALCALSVSPSYAQMAPEAGAQDELVVSATQVETPRQQIGSSVTVITSEEIARRKETRVTEMLRGVPGLDLVSTGGPGGNVAAFLRGANPEHTLVLIDGVEANDPIGTNRSFNFANLTTDNIERIEVLRGPQSTVYGSDALGGVISIITKNGEGPAKASFSAEAGSYDSFIERASAAGGNAALNASLGVSRQDLGGVSSARSTLGNPENDGFENTAVSAKIGSSPVENLDLTYSLNYQDAESEIDDNGGAGGDDPNRVFDSRGLFTRFQAAGKLFGGTVRPRAWVGYSDQEFSDNDNADPLHPGEVLRSSYDSSLLEFNFINEVDVTDSLSFLAGFETEEEKGSSSYASDGPFGPFSTTIPEVDARTNGYYLQAQLSPEGGFDLTAGVRLDDHSAFGSTTTWRVVPSYLVESTGTRLFGSIGTGYKAPSLYQLYSDYGSRSLREEESIGWDAGVEQFLPGKSGSVGATYFRNDFDDLISFDPATFLFNNIANAETSGVELFSTYALSEAVSLRGSYTYTDATDEDTGDSLVRRARNKFRVGATYAPAQGVNLTMNAIFTGKRFDNDFSSGSPTRVSLSSYTLLNAAASYDLNERIQLFARADNLLDEEYEEVLGYGTFGLAGFGGIKISL